MTVRPSYVEADDPAFADELTFDRASDLLPAIEDEVRRTKHLADLAYGKARLDSAEPKDLHRYLSASASWRQLLDQYMRERDRWERIQRDQEMSDAWQRESDELTLHLTRQYGKYGPQYAVLCQVVAPLVIKLRKSYTGGLRLAPGEQTDLTRTVMQLISQLQKHTESTKTETIAQHEIAVRVLSIVEKHLVQQPNTWRAIVQDVRGAIDAPRETEEQYATRDA